VSGNFAKIDGIIPEIPHGTISRGATSESSLITIILNKERKMKKIIVTGIILSLASLSYAETCPPVKDVFIQHNGKVQVIAPPGWRVELDQRKTTVPLSFSVAAWGDHLHNTDPVRCHYYNSYQYHVRLDREVMLPESAFANHANWTLIGNAHYYLCSNVGVDVRNCAFG
jgi:hypothetical protein